MNIAGGITRALALGALVAALGACSSGPETPRGLQSAATPMQPAERVPGAVVWRKPDLDPTRYTSFMVTPVKIYDAADADYGKATEADKRAMANYMQREFTRVLSERYPVTGAPGPRTARLELTLAGMGDNVPVASTAATVLPIGLVRNLTSGGQAATFSGSVTYKGELRDAQTNELLVAFVTSKTPSALDLAATVDTQAAQEAAVTESAKDLRDAIAAAQQQAAVRPGRR